MRCGSVPSSGVADLDIAIDARSEPAASSDGLISREFLTLAAAAACYFMAAGALNALIPTFVVDELDGTAATSGFVMGSFAISALLTRPFFGRMADRSGARRLLTVGGCLAASSMLVVLAVPTVAGMVASRLVLGAGGAAVMTGATLLSVEIAPRSRRSQAASYILIAFHVGLGLGPLAGEAILASTSYSTVWWIVGATSLAAAAISRLLPHRVRERDDRPPAPLVYAAAIPAGLVTLFGVFGFNGFLQFAPLYGREIGLTDTGLLFTTASLTIVAVRLVFGGVPDRIGPVRAGTGALFVSFGASVLVGVWATPAGAFIGAALLACRLSLQSPSFMAIAIDGVDERDRGSAMATYTAFFDIANAVVGPAIGVTVTVSGYRPAFLLTGVMALVGLAVLRFFVAPRRDLA